MFLYDQEKEIAKKAEGQEWLKNQRLPGWLEHQKKISPTPNWTKSQRTMIFYAPFAAAAALGILAGLGASNRRNYSKNRLHSFN